MSPIIHLASNYPFLNDWCGHELGHPDHDEMACAFIYGLAAYIPKEKDNLDQIWGHKYFYYSFEHEVHENIIDETLHLLPVFLIIAAYFLNFIEFDIKPHFVIIIAVFINVQCLLPYLFKVEARLENSAYIVSLRNAYEFTHNQHITSQADLYEIIFFNLPISKIALSSQNAYVIFKLGLILLSQLKIISICILAFSHSDCNAQIVCFIVSIN